jgi:hypothetical protein
VEEMGGQGGGKSDSVVIFKLGKPSSNTFNVGAPTFSGAASFKCPTSRPVVQAFQA